MIQVLVNLGSRSYPVNIGGGILKKLGSQLKALDCSKKVLLVTDTNVDDLYGELARENLNKSGFEVITARIEAGERFKSLATVETIYDVAYENSLDRSCYVLALGGGIVGDVAGFFAATYMRGVPFVQLPTTLLAQVDSSVGGKVAVNHPKGKNIIGAFYQPRLVLVDPNVLTTLNSREFISGLAEVIKYGIISSADFFEWLESNIHKIMLRNQEYLVRAVWESCRIKASVVEKDETEQGQRAILNFGHTAGHALEALTGYQKYTHGEAVGIGMALASRLAVNMEKLAESEGERICALIQLAGLPIALPEEISAEDIVGSCLRDKKVKGGKMTFVLPEKIGRVSIVQGVEPDDVINALQQ